ncbi:hypothetical protein DLJ82_6644 (plasmid) [Rhizobium leguminosarum]|uniref:Uncharacterized protein n=1 Tax=Rhizobium leguminosarum TaxID=384 RepID=A0A2Z4YVP3_RHILE|nr:hypothetical protein DLJ82_6644 [Rhizobium leguminosarum]
MAAGVDVTYLGAHMSASWRPAFIDLYLRFGEAFQFPVVLSRDVSTMAPRDFDYTPYFEPPAARGNLDFKRFLTTPFVHANLPPPQSGPHAARHAGPHKSRWTPWSGRQRRFGGQRQVTPTSKSGRSRQTAAISGNRGQGTMTDSAVTIPNSHSSIKACWRCDWRLSRRDGRRAASRRTASRFVCSELWVHEDCSPSIGAPGMCVDPSHR